MSKSLLEDVFKTPEKEVEYFSDIIKKEVDQDSLSAADKIRGSEVESVATPEFTKNVSGKIMMEHGWHSDDYVWHIEPSSRRGWGVSDDRVIYGIAKTLSEIIPNTVRVNVFPPMYDWDVRVFTFKALGLRGIWSVTNQDLEKLSHKLLEVLNTLAQ